MPQEQIHTQLNEAFKPFERFTEKATEAFCEILRDRMKDSGAYAWETIEGIRDETETMKQKILRAEKQYADGAITKEERDEWITKAQRKVQRNSVEIGAHYRADWRTFEEGLRIIQLLTRVSQ